MPRTFANLRAHTTHSDRWCFLKQPDKQKLANANCYGRCAVVSRIVDGDDDLSALSANEALIGKFFPETEVAQRAGIVCCPPHGPALREILLKGSPSRSAHCLSLDQLREFSEQLSQP